MNKEMASWLGQAQPNSFSEVVNHITENKIMKFSLLLDGKYVNGVYEPPVIQGMVGNQFNANLADLNKFSVATGVEMEYQVLDKSSYTLITLATGETVVDLIFNIAKADISGTLICSFPGDEGKTFLIVL